MAIGLGVFRVAGLGRRAGRAAGDGRGPRATVREVCLIGLDRRSAAADWGDGREVAWLGRTYRVRANSDDGPGPAGPPSRRYVHLRPREGE